MYNISGGPVVGERLEAGTAPRKAEPDPDGHTDTIVG